MKPISYIRLEPTLLRQDAEGDREAERLATEIRSRYGSQVMDMLRSNLERVAGLQGPDPLRDNVFKKLLRAYSSGRSVATLGFKISIWAKTHIGGSEMMAAGLARVDPKLGSAFWNAIKFQAPRLGTAADKAALKALERRGLFAKRYSEDALATYGSVEHLRSDLPGLPEFARNMSPKAKKAWIYGAVYKRLLGNKAMVLMLKAEQHNAVQAFSITTAHDLR